LKVLSDNLFELFFIDSVSTEHSKGWSFNLNRNILLAPGLEVLSFYILNNKLSFIPIQGSRGSRNRPEQNPARAQCYKTSCVRKKLECLSLTSFSSLCEP